MQVHDTDLIFGAEGQVVLMEGKSCFKMVGPQEGPTRIYLYGEIFGGGKHDLQIGSKFENLFGRFVAVVVDERGGKVCIIPDRYGLMPFYFWQENGRIVFGAHLEDFIRRGLSHTIDPAALSDISANLVPFCDRTLVSGVKSVTGRRAFEIRLDHYSLTTMVNWEPTGCIEQSTIPLTDVQHQLGELFMEGVEKATFGHAAVALTLSGGVDSRVLLAACAELGKDTEAYTIGVPESRSLVYAKRMADLCGAEHTAIRLGDSFQQSYIEINRANVRQTCAMSFSHEAESRYLRDRVSQGRVVLHGAFAELYKIDSLHEFAIGRGSFGLDSAEVPKFVWSKIVGRYTRTMRLFSEEVRSGLRVRAKDDLEADLRSYSPGIGTVGKMQCLYIDEFLRKVVTSSMQIWNAKLPTRLPFSYPPFVDLLLQVRPEDRLGNRFPAAFLAATCPSLLKVPNANTGVLIQSGKAMAMANRVFSAIKLHLFRNKSHYDHSDMVAWLKNTDPPLMELVDSLSANPMFDHSELARISETLLRLRPISTRYGSGLAQSIHFAIMLDDWIRENQVNLGSTRWVEKL